MGVVNGYDEAEAWLTAEAPSWRIAWTEARLVASAFVGGPTEQRVEAELVSTTRSDEVRLRGEGQSHLEAVQRALGAYNS